MFAQLICKTHSDPEAAIPDVTQNYFAMRNFVLWQKGGEQTISKFEN